MKMMDTFDKWEFDVF